MNKKKVIVVGVLLIALVLIVTGVLIAMTGGSGTYASKLEAGERYLSQGDYANAILQFRAAIDMDGSREEAYYGLYRAYYYSGQTDAAIAVLQVGISSTQSSNLNSLLIELQTAAEQNIQTGENSEPEQLTDKNAAAVLNTELLSIFASANYGDYCAKYGSESGTMSSNTYIRYLDTIGATLYYYNGENTVIDSTRGVPYSDCLPNEIRLDNITALFGGISNLTFEELKAMRGVSGAVMEGDKITFIYNDCEVTIISNGGVITPESENCLVPTTEVKEQNAYTMNAKVVDAVTNMTLSGAKVSIYEGTSTFGEPVAGTTDTTGQIALSLKASGTYTVVIELNGYITEKYEIIVMSNIYSYDEVFLLSPVMDSDGIRFVLSWGAAPADLDSYLVGKSSDGTRVENFFRNSKGYAGNGSLIVELDVDDINGYGPETTTLYDTEGSYEFYVDDYGDTGMISTSGAQVKIYVGSSLYTTVTIPAGIEDQWHVCTINNGQITVTNRSR